MNFGPEFLIGLVIAGAGGALWLLVRNLIKSAGQQKPVKQAKQVDLTAGLDQHDSPVIFIADGGQVGGMNYAARTLFNIDTEKTPRLESLARRVRPTDVFYQLCTEAGETTVTVEGNVVSAFSYPSDSGMLVVFQGRTFGAVNTRPHTITSKTLLTINEMTHLMAASLDLEDTIHAILESIFKIVPADIVELSTWDEMNQEATPYRLVKEGNLAGELIKGKERYRTGQGFAGKIMQNHQPLIVPDVVNYQGVQPIIDRNQFPIRTYMGFPLMVGKELIGTLELGSYSDVPFTNDDQEVLSMVCGSAAIAVHNSILFLNEQKRAAELSGLAQLAQSFSATRDQHKLFDQILESIKKLIAAEVLGFLLYNQNTHMLEAQVPFKGLPDPFVDIYKTEIAPNSVAEKLILSHDILMAENAAENEQWANLGLDHLARAASIRDSVMIPLTSGGQVLGFLQAANHQEEGGFSQSDMRLLMIIANQAAPVIENATLVSQSRQRTQRAEALRRIASLASSSVPVDEVLTYALSELSQLLRADVGVAFIMNQERSVLSLHRSSIFGQLTEEIQHTRLLSDDAQFPFTMTGSQKTLVVGEFDDAKPLVPFYQQILEGLKMQSAVIIPLVVRNEGIGEIWLANQAANFYDQGDVQVVMPAASQIAAVVEQSHLFSQTDESLRNRVEQLTSMARVSRELSTSLDLDYLVQHLYDEVMSLTKANSGGLSFFELGQDAEPEDLAIYSVVGDIVPGIFSHGEIDVIKNATPWLVSDCAAEKRFNCPNRVQSAMLVPVNYQQKPVALITLYHQDLNHFTQSDLEIVQSLAAQAAVAFGNAWQYREQIQRGEILKRELDTQEKFFQISDVLRPNQPIEVALNAVGQAIMDVTPFTAVLISVYDQATQSLKRIAGQGIPFEQLETLKSQTQPWFAVEEMLQDDFRNNNVYFIPRDRMPVRPADVHVVSIMEKTEISDVYQWHAEDLCFVPLIDLDGQPLGMISVDAPEDGLRPDKLTLDALNLFGMQTSLLLENYQYQAALKSQVDSLQEEKTLTGETMATQQRRILKSIQKQLDRFSDGLAMAAKANAQDDQETVLSSLANDLISKLGFSNVLIGEKQGVLPPELKATYGELPEQAQVNATMGQRNPLREVLENHSVLWERIVDETSQWSRSALMRSFDAGGFFAMTFPISDQRTIGLLAISKTPLLFQNDQETEMFIRLLDQVGVVLQNQTLLSETQHRLGEVDHLLSFSRKLGGLEPQVILDTLVQSCFEVIPNAQAGWAAIWDDQSGCLVPQAAKGYYQPESILAMRVHRDTEALPIRVYKEKRAYRVDEVNFADDYPLSAEDLVHYRQANGGRLPVSNLVVPLASGTQVMGVLVLENIEEAAVFLQEDENLAASLAQQAGLALENARLFSSSQRRSAQLQALTEVGSTITANLQSETLINDILDRMSDVIAFDTATLWMREGETLSVMATKGFSDDEDRVGISVNFDDSLLFQMMSEDLQPISVADVREDARFPSLMEPDRLSWLGVPLLSKSALIGIIALEKKEAGFYTSDGVQIAATFASQAAVALENAQLFEDSVRRTMELDQRSQRLALLNRFSEDVAVSMDETHILSSTLDQILAASGMTEGAVLVYDDKQINFVCALPEIDGPTEFAREDLPVFEHLIETQGMMIVSDVREDAMLSELRKLYLNTRNTTSLIITPLLSASTVMGWVLLESEEERRLSPSELELLRTLTNQAAVAVQNARLLTETRSLTEDLEKRVEERTAEMMREHNNAQTLLRITTELSASLDIKQVLQRTLAVLNESMQAQSSLIVLAQSEELYYAGDITFTLDEMGILPAGSPEKIIARWVMRERVATIVDDANNDLRWQFPEGEAVPFSSVLAVPLKLGQELLGTLLLTHQEKEFYYIDQVDLVEATARQISVALNNAELFNLIRDQAENLGSMLREQQIEASRSRAILEAVADGVLVTDAKNEITLLNQSASTILELKPRAVLGHQLDEFSGVFGPAASEWLTTIQTWTQDPTSYIFGDTYAEELTLDNERIISIHLAPVIWRTEFLGTVSVFRDITVEVQVDRMKSEFITNVSHELRTPLTAIKGYADIMLMGASGAVSDQQKHFLEIIRTNTLRLGVLVNDILDVSQMETDKMELKFGKVELEAITAEVIRKHEERATAEEKTMTFESEIPEVLPAVKGDPDRVKQIINNLVNNAFTYTPAEGKIEIKMQAKDKFVQIDVIDNGVGITDDIRDRVFERFYRGEDPLVLASAGTGLGLAVAKTLVEMHSGEIWFESSGVPGEGTVFSFTLPVYEAEE